MVLYHFNKYLLGLVSTYLCTYHCTEEFVIALANYVVSYGVRFAVIRGRADFQGRLFDPKYFRQGKNLSLN